jgi:hypothetical protein
MENDSNDYWPRTLRMLRDLAVRIAAEKHIRGDEDAFAFLAKAIDYVDEAERRVAGHSPAQRRSAEADFEARCRPVVREISLLMEQLTSSEG